jgi:uncharacterized membrane protein HdeD (DUF308 family)
MTNVTADKTALPAAVTENRAWFMALGIILILIGSAAVVFPFLTTIAAKTFLGWLLIIGGIAQIVHAFYTQKWSEFFLNLLIGASSMACSRLAWACGCARKRAGSGSSLPA